METEKNRRWQTVAVFGGAIEAHAARTKLESEGIECFVADEHTVGVNPLYATALGGIRLQVPPSDLDRAKEALAGSPDLVDAEDGAAFEGAPSAREADRFNRVKDPRCPSCGKDDISRTAFGGKLSALSWFLGSLALMIPLPWLGRKSWKCKSCGHVWKVRQ